MEQIKVSQNRRFLVTASNEPFFWLGDTAWELFHRLNLAEIRQYFANRQAKGFTVIQAVLLGEVDGLNTPNTNGDRPFIDNDPTRPVESYFAFVDEVVRLAEQHGLYLGMLPTWGDKVTHLWGAGPVVFNTENARVYGQFLGKRYGSAANILWILGGDRPAITPDHDYRPIWREMAYGLDEGCGYRPFKTYHPMGGHSTSAWLQDEDWLDMHMQQSGHGAGHDVPVWETIMGDYNLTPIRPVLDGEPNYEDHPVSPWPTWDPANGYFDDYDVRKQIYRSVFAGACGVTYGHQSIWQFITPQRQPITFPLILDWREALDRPAASQVCHLYSLMLSRPYLSRIPDQSILASDAGTGGDHCCATRDQAGTYAMIYLPSHKPVEIRLDSIKDSSINAWWYDPRTGKAILIGVFPAEGVAAFRPVQPGPDMVLVLDGRSHNYPVPGSNSRR
jgi:hypothetical protein